MLRSSSRPFVRSLEAKAVLSLISRFRSFPLRSGQQGYPDVVTARDREGIEATDLPSCQCCTGMKWLASKALLKTFCASLCRYVSDRRHAGRRRPAPPRPPPPSLPSRHLLISAIAAQPNPTPSSEPPRAMSSPRRRPISRIS